ncbi:MAG: hypothetical protein PVJ08_03180 [Dehalococcoidia bacterium]
MLEKWYDRMHFKARPPATTTQRPPIKDQCQAMIATPTNMRQRIITDGTNKK